MSLRVQRLRNSFITPRDLPRREEVCARLESSVGKFGPDVLARMLDEVLDPADPSVWVIRRLRLSFVIGEPKRAEETWARGITEGLRRQIQWGPDGGNVRRFPDRATYWAWFLRDLAAGSTLRWWYRQFESLQRLDFGAACLTLLSREPERAASVLAHLEEWGAWRHAAQLLNEQQAQRLLEWIAGAGTPPSGEVLDAAIDAWIEAASIPAAGAAGIRLSAVVRLLRRLPNAEPAMIRGAVEMVAETQIAFHSMARAEWVKLVAFEWTEPPGAPLVDARVPAPARLLLQRASRDKVEELVRAWESAGERAASRLSTTFATEFGGWFLLLPSYLSLEIDALADPEYRPALRWLMARMCMGPRGRNADGNDPALLWASGLEKAPSGQAMPWPDAERNAQWLAGIGIADEEADPEYFGVEPLEQAWTPVAACILRHFAHQLPGFGGSSPVHLDANLLEGRGSLRRVPGSAEVVLSRRPLDILLRMGGFDGRSYSIPWNDYATVTIRLD